MNATFKFTFTTREEYLTQVKEWSAQYDQAITFIRERKLAWKDVQRDKLTYSAWLIKYRAAYEDLAVLQDARYKSRREAHRQYTAQKEAA